MLVIDAIQARDFPVVQAVVIVFAGIFILCNLLVDIVITSYSIHYTKLYEEGSACVVVISAMARLLRIP